MNFKKQIVILLGRIFLQLNATSGNNLNTEEVEVVWAVTPWRTSPWRWRRHGPLKRLVSYHNTTRRQNPQDLDMNHHCRESVRTRVNTEVMQISILYFSILLGNIYSEGVHMPCKCVLCGYVFMYNEWWCSFIAGTNEFRRFFRLIHPALHSRGRSKSS
jgi:hypothetical protein